MPAPVSVVAQLIAGAGALGVTSTALALSAAELLLTLVEEGLLGLPGPTVFRADLIVLKETTLRRLQARTAIDEAHALQEQAIARQEEAEARRRVTEAVTAENDRTVLELANPSGHTSALPLDVASELREALREFKNAGGTVTVDSLEIRKVAKRRKGNRVEGRSATTTNVRAIE